MCFEEYIRSLHTFDAASYPSHFRFLWQHWRLCGGVSSGLLIFQAPVVALLEQILPSRLRLVTSRFERTNLHSSNSHITLHSTAASSSALVSLLCSSPFEWRNIFEWKASAASTTLKPLDYSFPSLLCVYSSELHSTLRVLRLQCCVICQRAVSEHNRVFNVPFVSITFE